ncbi:hypothetical protein [Bacillus swezeyi]|uniref:Uncharacterized protein n=1 Tax=Bacillus swezeyi TaxID=1925020 RepID=A0A5M8S2A6_9BACI|nr:hypothetical protein [Bacillus swezeyi]KAA6453566.1 hypothetical protein DX927_05100 [Bacillus swezeyi]KAA6475831.1 hypothetical protein DX928_06925 [Bacillus swezeyi]TYS38937.1 hypothetical protein FZC77_04975 [Bacillus swezeyi]
MTIIVTIIAAVIVIIGLVVFNVRSASPAKPEPAEEPRVERTSPVQAEEEAPEPASGENDQYVMTDQTYREILQKFQTPKKQNNAPKEEMDDMDYRNALKSMQKRDQD